MGFQHRYPEVAACRFALRRDLRSPAVARDSDTGERSMARTVAAFNAVYGTNLTETQGWNFMELLKMARSSQGAYVADDFDDKVAYAALAAECEAGARGRTD